MQTHLCQSRLAMWQAVPNLVVRALLISVQFLSCKDDIIAYKRTRYNRTVDVID